MPTLAILKYEDGAVADFLGDPGCSDAMSWRGAFGRRIPPTSLVGICGDCVGERRGIENEDMSGELLYESTPETEPADE